MWRTGRAVPLLAIMACVAVGCAPDPPVPPGFRSLPDVCGLVPPELVFESLGVPALPNPGYDQFPGNVFRSSPQLDRRFISGACQWNAEVAPPPWGAQARFGAGNLKLGADLYFFGDDSARSPDVEHASEEFRDDLEEGHWTPVDGVAVLGDDARQMYEVGFGSIRTHTLRFRKANVRVEIIYHGYALDAEEKVLSPPQSRIEAMTYEIAQHVSTELGVPR